MSVQRAHSESRFNDMFATPGQNRATEPHPSRYPIASYRVSIERDRTYCGYKATIFKDGDLLTVIRSPHEAEVRKAVAVAMRDAADRVSAFNRSEK